MNARLNILPKNIINKIEAISIHIIDIHYRIAWKFTSKGECLIKIATWAKN